MQPTTRNEFALEVEDIHASEIKKSADRRIPAVCMVVSRKAKLEPVPKAFFDPNIQIIPCDWFRIRDMKAHSRGVELMLAGWHGLGPGLEENARLAVHVESSSKQGIPNTRRQKDQCDEHNLSGAVLEY